MFLKEKGVDVLLQAAGLFAAFFALVALWNLSLCGILAAIPAVFVTMPRTRDLFDDFITWELTAKRTASIYGVCIGLSLAFSFASHLSSVGKEKAEQARAQQIETDRRAEYQQHKPQTLAAISALISDKKWDSAISVIHRQPVIDDDLKKLELRAKVEKLKQQLSDPSVSTSESASLYDQLAALVPGDAEIAQKRQSAHAAALAVQQREPEEQNARADTETAEGSSTIEATTTKILTVADAHGAQKSAETVASCLSKKKGCRIQVFGIATQTPKCLITIKPARYQTFTSSDRELISNVAKLYFAAADGVYLMTGIPVRAPFYPVARQNLAYVQTCEVWVTDDWLETKQFYWDNTISGQLVQTFNPFL